MKDIQLKADLTSGFLVFLIALPLCLGISMASGFPPISGLLTAIVGGLVVSFLGSSRLTIKGPAAGLIVIALGAITELGGGIDGYHKVLAIGVVAGVLQIIFALTKAGVVGDLMPSSVVHGMLAAIGVIIISKQAHTALGVTPHSKEPLHLLAEIPHSIANLNPEVFFIGLISLLILFGLPYLKFGWIKKVPAPMLVLLTAIPMGLAFDLEHEHIYKIADHVYTVGPNFLIRLPGSLLSAIAFPDFSEITSAVSIKYIIMFALVGSIESLLTVTAVDSLDPEHRPSNLNRDLLATGVGNVVSSMIGGLPMISEIVRSKANIDNGAKSAASNFFHGGFLLVSLALIPGILQEIPLAALAAMLIYTGFRLASPKEFAHVLHIGHDQLFLFVTTMLVTLASDLLIGVGVGLALKIILHIKNGVPIKSLFKTEIRKEVRGQEIFLYVYDSAVFTNFFSLKSCLAAQPVEFERVTIDFSNAVLVDHTVLSKLSHLQQNWTNRELIITGFENHIAHSNHDLAVRRKARGVMAI